MWIIRFSLILRCMPVGLDIPWIGIPNHVHGELAQNTGRAVRIVIKAKKKQHFTLSLVASHPQIIQRHWISHFLQYVIVFGYL